MLRKCIITIMISVVVVYLVSFVAIEHVFQSQFENVNNELTRKSHDGHFKMMKRQQGANNNNNISKVINNN